MSATESLTADPIAPAQPKVTQGGDEAVRTQGTADVEARAVEFAELIPTAVNSGAGSLDRLFDVKVTVTVELGRTAVSIGDVLKLGVGSVLELERPVSDPVDLVAQGIRLARGEVVVVNDRFAIRIKEIVEPKKRT